MNDLVKMKCRKLLSLLWNFIHGKILKEQIGEASINIFFRAIFGIKALARAHFPKASRNGDKGILHPITFINFIDPQQQNNLKNN